MKANSEQHVQAGLSTWLGTENPRLLATKSAVTESESSIQPATGASMANDRAPRVSDPTESSSSPDNMKFNLVSQRPTRIVKLNVNGRLLSSPPHSPTAVRAANTAPGRRAMSRASDSKRVVIKYSLANDGRISKLIDGILAGRERNKPTTSFPSSVCLRSSAPTIKKSGATTHPFFMKKSTLKPPNEALNNLTSLTDTSFNHINSESLKAVEAKTTSLPNKVFPSGFIQRSTKFPNLLHALWPPQDFTHIRDLPSSPLTCDPSSCLRDDHKKSKSPKISVKDFENVLLSSTERALRVISHELESLDTKKSLRLPERRIASGRALQGAIDRQLSWSLASQSEYQATAIPTIRKLYKSLSSSTSAFDCGKYEPRLWCHKYAPENAEDVLQPGREVQMLRDWLFQLKVSAVDVGNPSRQSAKPKLRRDKRRKKRRIENELDDFIVSSGEEASEMDPLSGSDDELAGAITVSGPRSLIRSGDIAFQNQHGQEKPRFTNAILISGPQGCGKTASVYAAAKELDFEVFEINSGSRRSARDMLERVGDMTQNHLVQLLNEKNDHCSNAKTQGQVDNTNQNKLMSFFNSQSSHKASKKPVNQLSKALPLETAAKAGREQKQSLILLEEADILFEEDRQFWTGVLTIISQSKRPIIITCTDESLIPVDEISLHAILRYQRPSLETALDYLLLVAAKEGHVLQRDTVNRLYTASGMDLRRSLMDLNFWCQMAVGSEKGGLDWILPGWPPGAHVDEFGDRLRVLSFDTYKSHMGWFNRDMFLEDSKLERTTQTWAHTMQWWGLSAQDIEDAAGLSTMESTLPNDYSSMTRFDQLEMLRREADYLDMRSALDILCDGSSLELREDKLDTSAPPISENHRLNYIEAHPLLQADLLPSYSSLNSSITTTFGSMISLHFRPPVEDLEIASANTIFKSWAKSAERLHTNVSSPRILRKTFEPIMRASPSTVSLSPRMAPSFENGLAPITEDIAPYVRAIMSYDGRLQEYRDSLYSVLVQDKVVHSEKRKRTTRASRAALEGGNKASTRKERWFSNDTNYLAIQRTGCPEWQQILFDMGYFHVQPVTELTESCSEPLSSEEI
ncbi:hypothetical protein N7539_003484 [Penicillium diatomitis]|uniref:AAA+ ATPase domain-containing protein n=1 Tax=Penicillium diatomitis TaxID=2819901 RepID=A0A9X0BXL0_9EURO|nr:uncharacterized protein N7539_003484 [Penicillium diatomitis]KAJ5488594.1 hypothetical protein N7539_003484 [Penicillium diatomitis]